MNHGLQSIKDQIQQNEELLAILSKKRKDVEYGRIVINTSKQYAFQQIDDSKRRITNELERLKTELQNMLQVKKNLFISDHACVRVMERMYPGMIKSYNTVITNAITKGVIVRPVRSFTSASINKISAQTFIWHEEVVVVLDKGTVVTVLPYKVDMYELSEETK